MYRRIIRGFVLFLCCHGLAFSLLAQEGETEVSNRSPYHTVAMHLHYLQPDSYQPDLAAKAIQGVRDSVKAQKIALQIKQVLDGKALRVSLSQLPDRNDYLDTLTRRAIFVLFPKEMPDIYLEKIEGNWYYSRHTINEIKALYKKVYPWGSDVLLNLMPSFGQTEVFGIALWQLIGLLFMCLIAYLLHLLLAILLRPLVKRMASTRLGKDYLNPKLFRRTARTLSLVLIAWLMNRWLPVLLLPIDAHVFLDTALSIILVVFIIFLTLRFIDFFISYLRRFVFSTSSKMDDQLVPIIYRVAQIIAVLAGTLKVLGLLDVNVAALIAGVSIGGLAIALAAQDSVKNLIGSVMIFVDRPFKIGDFISADGVSGTVEEVGFRSTRLRASDTSIFSIPNGKLADMVVNNIGLRISRRYKVNVGAATDTPLEVLDLFVLGLRRLILNHPSTQTERSQVHLNSLGDSTINILVLTYFQVDSWDEELITTGELIRGILKLSNSMGVRLAFPSQALYVESFPEKKSLIPDYGLKGVALEEVMNKVLEELQAEVEARVREQEREA